MNNMNLLIMLLILIMECSFVAIPSWVKAKFVGSRREQIDTDNNTYSHHFMYFVQYCVGVVFLVMNVMILFSVGIYCFPVQSTE